MQTLRNNRFASNKSSNHGKRDIYSEVLRSRGSTLAQGGKGEKGERKRSITFYICAAVKTVENETVKISLPPFANIRAWNTCPLLSTLDIPSLLTTLYLLAEFQIVLVASRDIWLSFLHPKGINENQSKPVIVISFPTASDWS